VVTYFSPSYVSTIESCPEVDHWGPLPIDLPGPVSAFLHHVRPCVLLIARTDLWPEVLHQCKTHHIPTLLFSRTQRTPRSFLQKALQKLNSQIMKPLTAIGCVTSEDRRHLLNLGINSEKVFVMGDTRYDQVIHRLHNKKPLKNNLFTASAPPVFVAGSTWPEDEDVILPALQPFVQSGRLRLILAPHEVTSKHLKQITTSLEKHNWPYCFYTSASEWPSSSVLIIDQIGILADLYGRGQMAFVGGSFRKTVHSVMEPLVYGNITFVGPFHANNREALTFQKDAISSHLKAVNVVHGTSELEQKIQQTLEDRPDPYLIQKRVEQKKGASQKVIEWVNDFLTAPRVD